MARVAVAVIALGFASCGGGGDTPGDAMSDADQPDAPTLTGGPLDPDVLHTVDITIAAAQLSSFDNDQTMRVPCDVIWDGSLLVGSGCRKKGSAGSVDPVTGKPAFSIKFDDAVVGQTLGPFDKMVLDNGVQENNLLNERLAYEVFRRAGVPAPRTAFAQVTFNGVPRGLYLAVEPVDKELLRERFGLLNDEGNLYESPSVDFATDPGGMDLKDEVGRSRADIEAAAAAVTGAPDTTFAADVGALIDLPEFIAYFAAEIALDSQDSYSFGRNNYYLYHRPDTDRFVFLPHGEDAILTRIHTEPDYPPAGRLAARVRGIAALSVEVDAALAAAAAPGGAFDADFLASLLDRAVAICAATTRDDDFTVGDLAVMRRDAPVMAAKVAWRGALLRGEVSAGTCGDGAVQGAEQCDDGGRVGGDGCDATCLPECVTISDAGTSWRVCPARRDKATQVTACAASGGALVVAADAGQAATIARVVRRHLASVDVWLGVNDEATDGTWVLDGGGAPPYLGFGGSEPNGGAAEGCAVLDTGMAGGWRDVPCDAAYPALCRLP